MMRDRRLILLAVASGFAGLGSETLLLELTDHVVGSSPIVSFVVVASFLLGFGVGAVASSRVTRPFLVEAVLVGYYLAWFFSFDHLFAVDASILAFAVPTLGPDLACALLGFVLVLPPAMLSGVVFPALVESRADSRRPYAWQAAGALFGIATIEAILLPHLGAKVCMIVLAAVHALMSMLLTGTRFRFASVPIGRPRFDLVALGAATGASQGIFLFLAGLLVEPFHFVEPLVVAVMLFGILAGTWIFGQLTEKRVLALVLVGAATTTFLVALELERTAPMSVARNAFDLCLVLLPTAIPIGAIFPAFTKHPKCTRADAGSALLSLSIGNTVGVLVSGSVLLAHLSAMFAIASVALVVLTIAVVRDRRMFVAVPVAAIPWVVAFFVTDEAFIARAHALRGGATPAKGVELRVTALFRGPAELSAIYEAKRESGSIERRLFQSGYSPISLDTEFESAIGVVGAAYANAHRRALVIGGGSGRTAGAVSRVFAHTDVVDIGATVPALVRALTSENFSLVENRGVTFHRLDGILAPYVFDAGFDLIVLTVDPGYHSKAAKLYTKEAFEGFARLLAPGGVFIFWADSSLDEEGNQILVNTGLAVFRHQKLFTAVESAREFPGVGYYFLIHSNEYLEYTPRRAGLGDIFSGHAELDALPGMAKAHIRSRATPGPHGLRGTTAPEGAPLEWDRLIEGRFHATRAVHERAHPASSIVLGGHHTGELIRSNDGRK